MVPSPLAPQFISILVPDSLHPNLPWRFSTYLHSQVVEATEKVTPAPDGPLPRRQLWYPGSWLLDCYCSYGTEWAQRLVLVRGSGAPWLSGTALSSKKTALHHWLCLRFLHPLCPQWLRVLLPGQQPPMAAWEDLASVNWESMPSAWQDGRPLGLRGTQETFQPVIVCEPFS